MSSGVGCTLWVDGVRVADGAADDDPAAPTALSGLTVTWGRSTTVDQPDPSTCAVDIFDLPGAASLLDVAHVGSTLEVTATGTIYPDPAVSTFLDPGFEASPPNTPGNNKTATCVRSTRRARTGAASAAVRSTNPARRGAVILAPAPFADPDDPAAWDAIPVTGDAQTWRVGASVFVPPGATVTLRAVLFTGPWASTAVVQPGQIVVAGAAAPVWRDVSAAYVPAVPGCWVGLQVEVWPTGYTWAAAPGTWAAVPADWTWDDAATVYVDDVAVLAPAAGTPSTVTVFTGRVTDLEAAYDESIPAPVLKIVADDFTADLDNLDVGDDPWTQETLDDRVQRVVGLVNAATTLPDVTATVDAAVAAVPVSWRDVDRQPARGLLAELASSVDGVLWSAVHRVTGPYLHVEDPASRPPADVLALVDGVVVIVPAVDDALDVSACDLLQDPATWRQTVADIATRVAVTWLEAGVDGDGAPITTERTVTVVDADREAAWGSRAYSLSTQLCASGDADAVAGRILARTGLGWRAEGITLDDDVAGAEADPTLDVTRVLTLLDGTARNGLLLRLSELPAWTPSGDAVNVYLEGGAYTFDAGRWILDLTVSSARATGASATWADLPPAWTWGNVDPSITWADVRGVGVDPDGA